MIIYLDANQARRILKAYCNKGVDCQGCVFCGSITSQNYPAGCDLGDVDELTDGHALGMLHHLQQEVPE